MTDRELLELAAKAAGIALTWDGDVPYRTKASGTMVVWNPLTDDGDALRLAVALGIGMRHHHGWSEVFHPAIGSQEFKHEHGAVAATRRAIVRAAAEIGRNMLSSKP